MVSKQYPEGLIGTKVGMTQVFTDKGECIPVTVIELGPCTVLDVCTPERDGYSAVQLGFTEKRMERASKAMQGHFARAGQGAFYNVMELRCDVETLGWKPGQQVRVEDVFMANEKVDVRGTSLGKGFSGVFRKFGVKGQPMTRGTHEVRRHIGAIGCRKFPGRVMKNQKMPGQLGNARVTVQNLRVVAVKPEQNVLLVRGAVPGAKGSPVMVRKAIKHYSGVNVPAPKKEEGTQEPQSNAA